MNNVADSILAVLRRYLSDATSRALLASAARRANLQLITISHADVPSLVRELGPGLNIFLQERTTLNHCKKELASIATENSTPVESPLPCNDDGRPREFDDRAQAPAYADELCIRIRTEHDIVKARTLGKEMAKQIGFSEERQTKVATAVSEVARNILHYAGTGEIRIRRIEGKRPGIEIVTGDHGPGISDHRSF